MEKKVIPIIPASAIPVAVEKLSPSAAKAKALVEVKPKIPYKPNNTSIIVFYICHKCNVTCDYCYWFRDIDLEDKITRNAYTRIIDEVAKRPNASLLLLGGEPTMEPELANILNYAVEKGVNEVAIGTNFIKPNKYYRELPHRDRVAYNISIHLDIFKDAPDSALDKYIDKIIEFYQTDKKIRIGMVIDNRYIDRLVHTMTRLKDVKVMKYPILPTHQDYTYYDLDQESADRAKVFFNEAFYKYTINGEEHDILDDATRNEPSFTGYWCNSNSIEIFANGKVSVTCSDRVLGNIFTTDDIVKNYNPLQRCTVPMCDNFNRILLKKWKYGKHT